MPPVLICLAGPNGAGKSTYHAMYLRNTGLPFVNADVAAARTGLDAYEAARAMDALRCKYVEERRSFVMETVFSDPAGAKLRFLQEAVAAGYDVRLVFIGLASARLSQRRVETRVRSGGHDVPREKLAARFPRTLVNLAAAVAALPRVLIYDNSFPLEPYRFMAEFRGGRIARRDSGRTPRWAAGLLSRG